MANNSINMLRISLLISIFTLFGSSWWILPVKSAKILAIETIGGKSHWNFINGVLEALVDKGGHHVTVFTPFPGGGRENYTVVDTSDGFPMVVDVDFDQLMSFWSNPLWAMARFVAMSRYQCDLVFGNAEMERLLSAAGPAFDAVVVEPFLSDCASYTAVRLNAPLILVMPLPTVGLLEGAYTGHAPNPAVVANLMADHGAPSTFVQRLTNAAAWLYAVQATRFSEMVLKRVAPRPYDALPVVPPSLILVNRHHFVDAPNPAPANVVSVGGVHLKAPERLPEDILDFIEQSTHGVILFTFGSTIKWSTIPKHIQKELIEGLAQIPQNILLKYEDEMVDKPKNMMIKNWLPQRDILMHPKVKLFISHGGIGGLHEAIDAGVPILGFPIFGDQARNIGHMVNTGMAISMDLTTVTKDNFLKNIFEIIDNEKYTQSAKVASKIYKDRPMSPAESIVYWTEYIIRHKGAPHLQSNALNLTWYQFYLLDVIAFLLIFALITIFVIYKFLKFVINSLKIVKLKSE